MQSLPSSGAWECAGYIFIKELKAIKELKVEKSWGHWRNLRTSSLWSAKSSPSENPILLCSSPHDVVDIFQKLEEDGLRSACRRWKGGTAEWREGDLQSTFLQSNLIHHEHTAEALK